MGYRSDVTAVFSAVNKIEFPVIKLWLTENFPIEDFKQEIRWFDRGMVLEISGTKWYPDFADVITFYEAVDDFVELFCTGSEGVVKGAYEFIRIGEDDGDIERVNRGDPDYFLGVNLSIECGV